MPKLWAEGKANRPLRPRRHTSEQSRPVARRFLPRSIKTARQPIRGLRHVAPTLAHEWSRRAIFLIVIVLIPISHCLHWPQSHLAMKINVCLLGMIPMLKHKLTGGEGVAHKLGFAP